MSNTIVIVKDPEQQLTELLHLDIKDYRRYNLTINKKYTNLQPHMFYVAIFKGYRDIKFEDLDKDIIYILEDINNGN